MSVDYDLVVIGTNAHAYELVSLANQAQTRVAWICDRKMSDTRENYCIKPYINISKIHHILQILKTQLGDRAKPDSFKLWLNRRFGEVL